MRVGQNDGPLPFEASFDFGEPIPFCRVFAVETVDTVFRRAFLS
jgi:hypothetical protein